MVKSILIGGPCYSLNALVQKDFWRGTLMVFVVAMATCK